MLKKLLVFVLFSLYFTAEGQVLPLREQARVMDEINAERINSLLPQLMQRTGFDMWIIIGREYNEDPVLKTMLPATWLNARRTTMLVFYNNPKTNQFEKLAIARYNIGETIKASWDMQKFSNQWDALADIVKQFNPQKIGINISDDFGHADGLVYTHYQLLLQQLPTTFHSRISSAQNLAVAWLETRTPREMEYYGQLVSITHNIINEGFSEKVITPGVTTTDDVVWWFRQKISELGLTTWFHPSVAVQRSDSVNFEHLRSFSDRPKDDIIRAGDLLHCDIGISYLRLNTDIQQHAYVLRPGEKDVPAGIAAAFERANRLQDILTGNFRIGKTGNEILLAALQQAQQEGIDATIYTHPLGMHGHAAGPTIGLWDQQGGVPGSGDYPLYPNTAYSIELNAASNIPEWKKVIRVMLEEDGYFDESGFRYINGRQREIHLIPRPKQSVRD